MPAAVSAKLHAPGSENRALTVEFLRNGEAWGDELPFGNPHFRFGKAKAQVVLAAWDIIEAYVGSMGSQPRLFDAQERYVPNSHFVNVKVVKQGEFINKAGILIEKHFLQFNFADQVWGFGLTKAQAVLQHQPIIDFVAKSDPA